MDYGGGGGGAATWFNDVGIGCPNYTLYGYCNYGIMCRLGSFHLNMSTGQNLRLHDDDDEEEKEAKQVVVYHQSSNKGCIKRR